MTVECPHCHAQTELQPAQRVRRNLAGLLGFAVLGVAIAGVALMLLKSRTAGPADSPKATAATNSGAAPADPARPKSLDDLKVAGAISIEKAKDRRLSYAMGTLKNDSDHQRFGVKIEIELYDSAGNKLPTKASDYIQTLEPRKEWSFRALILESKAATAKVASIQED